MLRVALFDIDGTLVSMGGAARDAFTQALREASGLPIVSQGASFVGRTDPQIARDLLTRGGVNGGRIEAAVTETLRLYLKYFARDLPRATGARLLPGVAALLDALASRDDVRVALLTGNLEAGARLKLDHFGITGRFDFALSAFGSDDADRYRLPAVALARARAALGPGIEGRQLVILGDSEHDVRCGREVGARAVAVATGWTAAEVLGSHAPDRLLPDFTDTAAAVEAILG